MKLLLCGGGSGEQTIEANKKFDEIINHNKPLLYVPLAMDENKHPYDGCLEWITRELSNVNIPSIEMVRTFEELASKDYNNYCAIFIGGGNTGNSAMSAPISLIALQRLTFSNQSLFVSGIIYAF